MPQPELYIRDVVLPLLRGEWRGADLDFEDLVGTAFLIGRRGVAITAAHVVEQLGELNRAAVASVNAAGKWVPIRISQFEIHTSEDVAVVRLETCPAPSWLVVSDHSGQASLEYDCWGYPIAASKLSQKYESHGLEQPDLLFTRGYVRRRFSRALPSSIYRGTSFYELSELAGGGCSGGPMIARSSLGGPTWSVTGVYIGECNAGFAAGYSVRTDAISTWAPTILGRSIREESLDR